MVCAATDAVEEQFPELVADHISLVACTRLQPAAEACFHRTAGLFLELPASQRVLACHQVWLGGPAANKGHRAYGLCSAAHQSR